MSRGFIDGSFRHEEGKTPHLQHFTCSDSLIFVRTLRAAVPIFQVHFAVRLEWDAVIGTQTCLTLLSAYEVPKSQRAALGFKPRTRFCPFLFQPHPLAPSQGSLLVWEGGRGLCILRHLLSDSEPQLMLKDVLGWRKGLTLPRAQH